jgi:hypothetical protein
MPSNLTPAIYGTIAVGSLLAVESARRETYAQTVIGVLITLLLYWLAHSYAECASDRLRRSEPFTLAGLLGAMTSELSILLGAALPIAVLLAWWTAGGRLTTAVSAAIWTSAATVVIIEVAAGLRAEQKGQKLAQQTLFGALLGLLIISLRLALH